MKPYLIAALLLAATGFGTAHAASCSVATSDTSFSAYSTSDELPSDTTASITMTCSGTGTAAYSIGIGASTNGGIAPRQLSGPVETLDYNLYTDANRSEIWGDVATGGSTVSGMLTPPGTTMAIHTVYGRIPALQNVQPGTYADSLTITVSY